MSSRFRRRLVSEIRRWVKSRPGLYLRFVARGRRDHDGTVRTLTPRTEIVLDAFPRSGNSYAVHAFRLAQDRPVEMAHHLHAPALILQGCRLGLPTLTLLREPADAVSSLATAMGRHELDLYLLDYISYYTSIRACRPCFVLARFESVFSNFGEVIRFVNERFETSFQLFETTPANVAAVHEQARLAVQRLYRKGGEEEMKRRLAVPSEERRIQNAAVKRSLEERHPDLLARAREVYEEEALKADI